MHKEYYKYIENINIYLNKRKRLNNGHNKSMIGNNMRVNIRCIRRLENKFWKSYHIMLK